MSSDTPLTDAKVFLTRGPGFNSVDPNFARTLERRVSQLEAQLAEARKDSERLDWLDEKKADLCELNGWRAYDLTQEAGKIQRVRSHPTTRAAIDAAMKP
jgi:hypothetical protein